MITSCTTTSSHSMTWLDSSFCGLTEAKYLLMTNMLKIKRVMSVSLMRLRESSQSFGSILLSGIELPNNKVNSKLTLILIFINAALYSLCWQMQRPLEPFLIERLTSKSTSSTHYGKVQSFFHLFQIAGTLAAGICLDKYGVKGCMMFSFLGCAISYAILSNAFSMNMLYLSKAVAMFQAGFLCAQVGVAQLTTPGSERAASMGILTASYNVGSVLGPILGGILGLQDYYFVAKLAVVGSLVSLALTLLMPSIERVNTKKENQMTNTKDDNVPSMTRIIAIVWVLFSTKYITSIANSMAATTFPLILKNRFHLNEASLGNVLSVMAIFNVIATSTMGPIIEYTRVNLKTVIGFCILSMGLLSLLQATVASPTISLLSFDKGLYEYIGLSFVLSMFQYVLSTTITSESTSLVGPKAKGTLIGLEHSLFAAARVITPQIGVYLLQSFGVSGVTGTCALVFMIVFGAWQVLHNNKNIVATPIKDADDKLKDE